MISFARINKAYMGDYILYKQDMLCIFRACLMKLSRRFEYAHFDFEMRKVYILPEY